MHNLIDQLSCLAQCISTIFVISKCCIFLIFSKVWQYFPTLPVIGACLVDGCCVVGLMSHVRCVVMQFWRLSNCRSWWSASHHEWTNWLWHWWERAPHAFTQCSKPAQEERYVLSLWRLDRSMLKVRCLPLSCILITVTTVLLLLLNICMSLYRSVKCLLKLGSWYVFVHAGCLGNILDFDCRLV